LSLIKQVDLVAEGRMFDALHGGAFLASTPTTCRALRSVALLRQVKARRGGGASLAKAIKCKSLPVIADRDQQKSRRTASGVTRWPVKDLPYN
jgi:hypothetical protein